MCGIFHDSYLPGCKKLVKDVAMGPSSRFIITDMVMTEKGEMGTEVTPYWMGFNRNLVPPITRILTSIYSNDVERNGEVEEAV